MKSISEEKIVQDFNTYLVYGLQVSKISGGLEKYFVSDGTPLSKVVRKIKHIPNH